MALENNGAFERRVAHGAVVGLVTVSDDGDGRSRQGHVPQALEDPSARADITPMPLPSWPELQAAALHGADVAGAAVWRRVEVIHEPRPGADQSRHAELIVLRELEGLEMVEYERLAR